MRIEPICQALHVSRTTRYCRLKEEGTSFSSLVAEVRQELSAELICQGAGGDGQRAAGGQGHEHVPPCLQALVRPPSGSLSRGAMGLPIAGSMAR